MTTRTKYSTAAQLLDQARKELDCGDVRQASEKGWCAAAQAVKAVAEARGWDNTTQGDVFRIVRLLGEEPGGDDLGGLFGSAALLQRNARKNWFTAKAVEEELEDVGRFVKLMAEIGSSTPPIVQ